MNCEFGLATAGPVPTPRSLASIALVIFASHFRAKIMTMILNTIHQPSLCFATDIKRLFSHRPIVHDAWVAEL